MRTHLDLARALRDQRLARSEHQRILTNRRVADLLAARSRRMSPEEMRDEWDVDDSVADFCVQQRRRAER